jgi:hypothetical protein
MNLYENLLLLLVSYNKGVSEHKKKNYENKGGEYIFVFNQNSFRLNLTTTTTQYALLKIYIFYFLRI